MRLLECDWYGADKNIYRVAKEAPGFWVVTDGWGFESESMDYRAAKKLAKQLNSCPVVGVAGSVGAK